MTTEEGEPIAVERIDDFSYLIAKIQRLDNLSGAMNFHISAENFSDNLAKSIMLVLVNRYLRAFPNKRTIQSKAWSYE